MFSVLYDLSILAFRPCRLAHMSNAGMPGLMDCAL
ncbi:hypothetical protein N826_00810 [Skermanella aerolata KACC 11604]|nr:hypothetical protein N826_00810 [Skermanella aerolata KACC 11604]